MPSCNLCCRGKTVTIACTEVVSTALVIQNSMRMRCIILSSVSYMVLPYLSALSHIRHGFRGGEGFSEHKLCVLIFSTILSQMSFIPTRIGRDLITNVHSSSCKFPVILTSFFKNLIFSKNFRKILKYKISWKYVQWEQSCFMETDRQTDGQTDMMELITTSSNFLNASKDSWLFLVSSPAGF